MNTIPTPPSVKYWRGDKTETESTLGEPVFSGLVAWLIMATVYKETSAAAAAAPVVWSDRIEYFKAFRKADVVLDGWR